MSKFNFPSSELLSESLLISDSVSLTQPSHSSICSMNVVSVDKTDLSNPDTLSHLVSCLLFACVTECPGSLSVKLGLSEALCNSEALSLWVLNETRDVKFIDASALFNYLANRLDALLITQEGGHHGF